ncbi:MAG: J domain-containing protein [Flavobacteriales bacterium]
MKSGNPFKILGIKPDASPQEVRRAYRSLVKKYHPDKNKQTGAQEKFIAIQAAYEQILHGKPSVTQSNADVKRKESQQAQEDANQRAAYEAYRKQAREKYAARKKAEEAYKAAYLNNLKTSWKGIWHQTAAILGLCLFFVVWVDFFLSEKTVRIYPESYGLKTYQSMNGHFVQLFKSTDDRNFWLADYFSQELIKSNTIHTVETPWLHQVKSIQLQDNHFILRTPVHFTFYWAQIWVSLAFLFPFVSWRFASADIIFVAGSYFSRFMVGPFILYFLLTEQRWLHLLSFGAL